MNNDTRARIYLTDRATLTAKQQRRINKKQFRMVGEHGPEVIKFEATGPDTGVVTVKPKQVRAKVGIITYTGFVVGDEFHYKTKADVAKVAKKFTVLS